MDSSSIKESDLYETPPEIFKWASQRFGPFDLDVCAEERTKKAPRWFGPGSPIGENAFSMEWWQWGSRAWMNPPYSNPRPWIEKARAAAAQGLPVVALLPSDTSTGWWHKHIENNPHVYYEHAPQRIRFLYKGSRSGSPKFGSTFVLFFPEIEFPKARPNGS